MPATTEHRGPARTARPPTTWPGPPACGSPPCTSSHTSTPPAPRRIRPGPHPPAPGRLTTKGHTHAHPDPPGRYPRAVPSPCPRPGRPARKQRFRADDAAPARLPAPGLLAEARADDHPGTSTARVARLGGNTRPGDQRAASTITACVPGFGSNTISVIYVKTSTVTATIPVALQRAQGEDYSCLHR
jgi:hypothetical protein